MFNAPQHRIALASGNAVRALSIGASNAWKANDGAFDLQIDTHEMYFQVNDQSGLTIHKAFVAVPLPVIVQPTYGEVGLLATRTIVTAIGFEIEGSGWTGMPTRESMLLLHGATTGTIVTFSDPAANVSTLNTRRTLITLPNVVLDPTEPLMLEMNAPQNGSGSGRSMKYYRAFMRFATRISDGAEGYDVAGAVPS